MKWTLALGSEHQLKCASWLAFGECVEGMGGYCMDVTAFFCAVRAVRTSFRQFNPYPRPGHFLYDKKCLATELAIVSLSMGSYPQ